VSARAGKPHRVVIGLDGEHEEVPLTEAELAELLEVRVPPRPAPVDVAALQDQVARLQARLDELARDRPPARPAG
jgi:ubiquinone biosynthesis protein UbiJ